MTVEQEIFSSVQVTFLRLGYKAPNPVADLSRSAAGFYQQRTHIPSSTLIMKKVLFLALAAASFSFASCDSKKEEAQEGAADAVEASGEAKADAMEEAADSTRDAADATADAMENSADKVAAPATEEKK